MSMNQQLNSSQGCCIRVPRSPRSPRIFNMLEHPLLAGIINLKWVREQECRPALLFNQVCAALQCGSLRKTSLKLWAMPSSIRKLLFLKDPPGNDSFLSKQKKQKNMLLNPPWADFLPLCNKHNPPWADFLPQCNNKHNQQDPPGKDLWLTKRKE